jgi:alpha-L-fucosidase 2
VAWPDDEARCLKARGDVEVDIIKSGGKARQITLYTGHAERLSIRSTVFSSRFTFVDEITGKPIALAGKGERRTFLAKNGGRYRVKLL